MTAQTIAVVAVGDSRILDFMNVGANGIDLAFREEFAMEETKSTRIDLSRDRNKDQPVAVTGRYE